MFIMKRLIRIGLFLLIISIGITGFVFKFGDELNNGVIISVQAEVVLDKPATYVLGQLGDFTTGIANNGGISANSLNSPNSSYSDGSRVYVGDTLNNRVLIYNGVPGEEGWDSTADYVIGQPDFTSNTTNNGGLSADSINGPWIVYSDGGRVYVADLYNQRVLIYNGVPGEEGWDSTADYVLGQGDVFNTNTANKGGRSANSLYFPMSVYSDGGRVYVADAMNHRVLIYNGVPGGAGWDSTADYVLGQGGSFTSGTVNNGGLSANSLQWPTSVYSDENRVYVADSMNHRVLIYNGVPGEAGWDSTADYVLGQGDVFNTNTANNGGTSANSLKSPEVVSTYGDRVYVGDVGNRRVLVYNGVPGSVGWDSTADYVLGQGGDFTTGIANKGGLSASSLWGPRSVCSDGIRLYIAEISNNRVSIYNLGPQNIISQSPSHTQGTLSITLGSSDATDYLIKTTQTVEETDWMPFSTSHTWTFGEDDADGEKTLWVKMRDYLDYESDWIEVKTVLDRVSPTLTAEINNGLELANSTDVLVNFSLEENLSGVSEMVICESSDFTGCDWESYTTTKSFVLSAGDGVKTIYAKVKDGAGNISEVKSAQITLDRTSPTLSIEFGSDYTATKEINISLRGEDSLSGLDKMVVCGSSEFTGCEWEAYSATKTLTLSTGDGVKTIYAKVKDKAGNESEVAQDTIILDTINNKPVITKLGLIKNITDKDSLYYHFDANKVRIYGTAESNSTVVFDRVNGTKYTTQADAEGKFLIVIDLPNGETKLTYSSTDLAGNVSGSRTITLNIDPSYGTRTEEPQEEIIASSEETEDSTDQVETEQEAPPVVKSLLVVDSSGNILSNKTIVIEGKEYKTDERGYIHTDQGFTSDLIASIEGRNYTIKPSNTYLTLTEAQEENKKFNYLYLIIALILIITISVFILKRKKVYFLKLV